MLAIFITVLISSVVSFLFGYAVHRALHQPWTGKFNSSHMTHHLTLYPPTDYQSDEYRYAGKDNSLITFALAAIPVVLIPIILGLFKVISLVLVITALMVMGLMSFLHNYLHDSFHIRNHWLNKIPVIKTLFARWEHLHYLHHVDMNTNYGIFSFILDKVFGTYWSGK